MKKLITIFICLLSFFSEAQTTYYVASFGSSTNSGTIDSPWNLDKVNTFNSFNPGDQILFKKGDTFYGTITVSNSGSSGNPITYGAYGTGENPVITGFTNVSSWTNLGSNIWESSGSVSTLSSCNMVVINGINTPMGRYPNTGSFQYQSHTGNNSITSSSLTGSPNWTGANVVIKESRYDYEIGAITAQSGSALTYTSAALGTPQDGFGLFIQNDIRTLDVQNEWYYNPSTKKLSVYSTSSPTGVQIASLTTVLNITGQYIVVDGIDFSGANGKAVTISNNHVIMQNCNISFAGIDGIAAGSSTYLTLDNNSVKYCNDNGIISDGDNATITNNTLRGIGIIPGMTQFYSYAAIRAQGANILVQYNNLDSTGFNGIEFGNANIQILNNLVNHACMIKDDGGGLYTAQSNPNQLIKGNIILNTLSPTDDPDSAPMGFGIYLDSWSSHYTIEDNTIYGGIAAGLFISNSDSNTVRNNTLYNNSLSATGFSSQSEIQLQHICCNATAQNTVNSNIVFGIGTGKYLNFFYESSGGITGFGSLDSNYYVGATANSNQFSVQTGSISNQTFSSWKSSTSWDSHSTLSTLNSNAIDSLVFKYNATSSPVTIPLYFKYIDAKGTYFNSGSITLQPYTSAVLINNGALAAAPTVSLSGNQSITVNYTTIYATPVWASGHTGTVLWTKTSGPGATTITPSGYNATVSNLQTGTYVFRCTATQDDSQSAYAEVTIDVAIPLPPSAYIKLRPTKLIND